MRIGILITARLGSTRLSRKHLKLVCNKPIINFLIDRIYFEFSNEIENDIVKIVIATGRDSINNEFESISDKCSVFFGNDDNIPLRHLEAAEANNFDVIVSIDGDDILCSTTAMKLVANKLESGISMAKTSGLPLGMNVMGYRKNFLADSIKDYKDNALETGWGRIFDPSKIIDIPVESYDHEDLRFTLDYDLDFDFFNRVINDLEGNILDISDKDLVDFVVENRIFDINASIAKEYWENFNKNIDNEKLSNKEA